MSSQLAAQNQPALEYYLKTLTGNLKSTVFRLTSKEIFIGRDSSNHIVIPGDSKVSRKHARIIFHKNQYYIQNITSNNFITINGEKTKQRPLFNNCVIGIGGHSFKFVTTPAQKKQNHLTTVDSTSSLSTSVTSAATSQNTFAFQKQSPPATSNRTVLYGVIGVIFVLIFASSFLKQKPKIERKLEDIETNQKILERIRKSQAAIDAYKKNLDATGKNSRDYKKSKELFIKGFRDFQKSQFSSAIGSFEVALVHNPENIEAKRYLELAKRRSEELIEYHMNQGRAHKENYKFDFCISSFKNVMIQLNDKTDSRYEEAKQLLKECSLLQRSKY